MTKGNTIPICTSHFNSEQGGGGGVYLKGGKKPTTTRGGYITIIKRHGEKERGRKVGALGRKKRETPPPNTKRGNIFIFLFGLITSTKRGTTFRITGRVIRSYISNSHSHKTLVGKEKNHLEPNKRFRNITTTKEDAEFINTGGGGRMTKRKKKEKEIPTTRETPHLSSQIFFVNRGGIRERKERASREEAQHMC